MNRRQFLATSLGLFFVPSIIGRAMVSPSTVPKRKLKAVWTVKCEQDLLNLHGISPDEPIILGFRGKTWMEEGIVYAPWIPLQYDSGSKQIQA